MQWIIVSHKADEQRASMNACFSIIPTREQWKNKKDGMRYMLMIREERGLDTQVA